MAKKKGGNGYGGYNWASYNSYFTQFESRFAATEDRRNFKNKIKEKSLETFTPLTARVNNEPTSFIKRRKMIATINTDELSKYSDGTNPDKIIEAYDKMPFNSDIIDSEMVKHHITKNSELNKFRTSSVSVDNLVNDYMDSKITYAQFRSNFRMPTPGENNLFGQSKGGYEGFGRVGCKKTMDKIKYNRDIKVIRDRIKLLDIESKEENLRKGKRINRAFLNNTSYKPLMSKSTEAPKKKKLFVIVDCSGSMGCADIDTHPAYTGMSFTAACVNSGVFDVEHVICHSNGGWENVCPALKKGELFNYEGGSEGFEVIDDNLDYAWLDGVDYIVVITDLQIGSSAERGLYNYIKNKKHMILSYRAAGTLKGLNVRQITGGKDMINALTTLTS